MHKAGGADGGNIGGNININSQDVANTLWARGVCDDWEKPGGAADGAAGAAGGGDIRVVQLAVASGFHLVLHDKRACMRVCLSAYTP